MTQILPLRIFTMNRTTKTSFISNQTQKQSTKLIYQSLLLIKRYYFLFIILLLLCLLSYYYILFILNYKIILILLEIYPLDYWKSVSTSAPVETLFSISGNIVSKSRNRMAPETVKKTVLLQSWNIKKLRELEEIFRNSAIIEEG